jgi:DNA polymerase-3 subunit gamma/tau
MVSSEKSAACSVRRRKSLDCYGVHLYNSGYPPVGFSKQVRPERRNETQGVSSLYRTWRPKSFDELVGQDAVVRTLRSALSTGRLAHAYLFSGPRGSGKTSAAKIMARCIDCVHGPTPDPDNTCENCLAILSGTALDVVEIDAASNRGIEEIRALREAVKFAPASMRYKVFIIDEAHMLTREGANAFLKTLEEPPPHVIFILATTAPEALPPTILSRCQRYAFRRIPVSTMIERMRTIAAAENIPIDDAALGAIAYRADGGLRDALTMLEQVAAYAGGPVDAATVDAAFGTTGRAFARDLVAALLAGDAARGLRIVDEASDAGADMLGLIRGTIGEFRNLLVARIDAGLLSRDLAQSDAERVVALAAATPQAKVVRGLRLLGDALAAGRTSGNPRLELETAVLRLALAAEDQSLESIATRVTLLEQGAPQTAPAAALGTGISAAPPAAPGPPPKAAPKADAAAKVEAPAKIEAAPKGDAAAKVEAAPKVEPASKVDAAPKVEAAGADEAAPESAPEAQAEPEAPPRKPAGEPSPAAPVTLQRVRSLWDQIRLRAEEQYKPMRGPLSRATVDALEGDRVIVGLVDSLNEGIVRARLPVLEAALADALGTPLRVSLKVVGSPERSPVRSAHRSTPSDTSTSQSADDSGGEADLLAYARRKLGGSAPE